MSSNAVNLKVLGIVEIDDVGAYAQMGTYWLFEMPIPFFVVEGGKLARNLVATCI